MRKCVVEFIGTLFLVLTIGCCVMAPAESGIIPPLAIGSALMGMVYAGAHISGAHYNPAVTFAITLRGRSTWSDAAFYMVAQILGAIAAVGLLCALGFQNPAEIPIAKAFWPPVLAEFLFTFALVWVVLNVAIAKGTAGNSYFGLAIGFTVLGGAFAVTGGAFNPAVAVALSMLHLASWSDLVPYFAGEFAGASAAAFAFRYCNGNA